MPRIQPINDQCDFAKKSFGDYYIQAISYFSELKELLSLHEQLASSYAKKTDLHILNIGCDFGHAVRCFAEYASADSQVIGLDINSVLISRASARITHPKAEFQATKDLTKLDFETNSFDLIYIERILHTQKHPDIILDEVRRILKPKGRCIICEPDLTQFNCNVFDQHINQQLCDWFCQRITSAAINKTINTYINKHGILLADKHDLWLTINDYSSFDNFYSFRVLLTLFGYDLPEMEQYMQQLQDAAQKNHHEIRLPLVIYTLDL